MSEILCVDVHSLTTSNEVQKDIKLLDILNNHTAYIEKNRIHEDDITWRPLSFSTVIRTTYSNRVVYFDDRLKDRKVFYTMFTDVGRLIHEGYDLVMYMASQCFMSMLREDVRSEDVNKAMQNSQFQCNGLYYGKLEIFSPIILSTIIFNDDLLFDKMLSLLSDGYGSMSIEDMCTQSQGNIRALLDDIILVKGENHGENDNH